MTVDIAALRERLADRLDHMECYGGRGWLDQEEIRLILSKLDQVEAAQARIAELESEQEPVGYTGSGSLLAIAAGHAGYIWGEHKPAHPLPLYTAPPKPVVKLPDSVKAQDYHIGGDYLEREEVETSLKAAGITIESE
ncbi:hypothetical protein [Rouxiella sp. Mn2063]|uniref:hypothetical protein n=1 Tax=Rouxiella sp. Mn2063 TaxID=3395262 RepID=UPI003BCBEC9C